MADNTAQNGTDTIATDDLTSLNGGVVSGVKAQRVKVGFGSDGSFRDVDASNPLPATPLNVTISGTLSASDAVVAAPVGDGTLITGTSTAGSIVYAAVPDGMQAWTLLIKGFVSGAIYTEASNNSTNGTDGDWVEVKGRRTGTAPGTESVVYTMVSNGYYRGNAAGFKYIRARLIGGTGPTVQWVLSNGQGATFLNSGLPQGSSVIGAVTQSGTWNIGSIATMPSTPVTGTFWQATQPVSGTFWQSTQPVSIASMPSTPVTGTFWQTTQPVSIASMPSTPVTGTFWQATQPVSLAAAVTANQGTAAVIANAWFTKPGDGTNSITVRANSSPPATTDTALVVTTRESTAKGTQGSIALPTQDLKDAGRNQVHFYTVIPVLATATDTLQSLTGTKAGATVTATTTPAVVTTGKTLRVTRLAATYIATATSGYGMVRLRFNTGGVVALASPIAATLAVGSAGPVTANATGSCEAAIDEGWEFAAGTGIGISVQGFAAATATAVGYVLVSVTGYEY